MKTYKIELELDHAAFLKIRGSVNVQNLLGEAAGWDVSHEFANRLIVAIQNAEDMSQDIVKLKIRSRD